MYLKNQYGWQMNTRELKDAMGFEKDWPRKGVLPTEVSGELVYVLPRSPEPITSGTGKHRAMVICRHCEKHVPAGRYHQHRKYKH